MNGNEKMVVVNNAPAALATDYANGYKRGADDERAMVCNWLLATGNASAHTVASIRAGLHWQAQPEVSDLIGALRLIADCGNDAKHAVRIAQAALTKAGAA